jgi:hypothetical protein
MLSIFILFLIVKLGDSMVNSGPHLTCVGQASQDVAAESAVERETLGRAHWTLKMDGKNPPVADFLNEI